LEVATNRNPTRSSIAAASSLIEIHKNISVLSSTIAKVQSDWKSSEADLGQSPRRTVNKGPRADKCTAAKLYSARAQITSSARANSARGISKRSAEVCQESGYARFDRHIARKTAQGADEVRVSD
jgi:hypothetical protein